ncbi:MAG: VOC family protein [Rhodospirillaceae bacterium]|jgi:glyoxylase I family protein|nr:VOC family protein [Rhodospirillaceae bacterium]
MIRGVHHVSISTNNHERLVGFYRDLIGLPFATSFDWEAGNEVADRCVGLRDSAVKTALLRAGNTFVEIFEYTNPPGAEGDPNPRACDPGLTHICFDVVDIEGEYARLSAAGVEFHTEPVEIGGIVKATYGRDPDGNIFEMQEVIGKDLPMDIKVVVPDVEQRGIQ